MTKTIDERKKKKKKNEEVRQNSSTFPARTREQGGGVLESSKKTIPARVSGAIEGRRRRVYRATLLYGQKKRGRGGGKEMVAVHTDGVRNTESAQCPETIAGKIV